MFAGDKYKPAADASYRNLLWENFYVDHSFNFGTKTQNKEIGTIDRWGPFYRVSFDLIIHSFQDLGCEGSRCPQRWSSLLAFRKNGTLCDLCTQFNSYALDVPEFRHQNYEQICDRCDIGDRIPAFFLNNLDRVIRFSNNVDNSEHYFDFEIELNHWYNIVFEQNSVNGKVITQNKIIIIKRNMFDN